jgi:serine protease Do
VATAAQAASVIIRGPGDDVVDSEPDEGGVPQVLDVPAAGAERTLGAGVIVDPRGVVLTSARAVLHDRAFDVVLADGTPLTATVLGVDRRTDVAVLKLASGDRVLPYLPLGDSDRLRVGDNVIAVGAPLGLAATVTAGIITATPAPTSQSPLRGFLQTDAAMGRGNTGGPLVNLDGEIVGLGTVLFGDGIGYVLPSRTVRKIYVDLVERGRVSRSWLGVTTQSLTADLARALGSRDAAGVLIADVDPEGPAARSGLRSGDIVVEIEGTSVSSRAQLAHGTDALAPGRVIRLKLRRDGHELTASVRLGEEPDDWSLPAPLEQARRLLGIEVRRLTPAAGVAAARIDPTGVAARAGLEPGDIIREVNRQTIKTIADFQASVRMLAPGGQLLMLVQREDIVVYVTMTAGE